MLSTTSEVAEISKNIKQYEKQFNAFDEAKKKKQRMDETKGKRRLRSDYRSIVLRLQEWRGRQKEERMEFNGGYDSDDEDNYMSKEVVIETILSSKEETVFGG